MDAHVRSITGSMAGGILRSTFRTAPTRGLTSTMNVSFGLS
ncbi:MAG: hypothetical protein QXG93_03630 [Nitrososphaerota archaeon]